ncbi:methylmalonyl-CoA mutase family protein [Lutibacter sp. TH_r2]|uniref:methylmalonyl-CoA mutase family protein n=1 Tax=Lutibacter sp. TH_r2 TaxID=3082083 RepID=UPI002953E48F|nr:methylmalonyl-CoA mutase family protein [Lutibacter sp. TH_r2]MDV7185823.1 methylmalonyl-CoA mutase family protein [Lutibacter sp. TH_r2]
MKRKNFSHLKIKVQTEKTNHFKHEGFIAGTPPFLRGNHSFTTTNSNLNQHTINQIFPYDINEINTTKNIVNEKPILLTNQHELNSELQIAQLLLKASTILKNNISNKIKIDAIAPKIHIGWKTTNNLISEIGKIRATRMLWAKIIQQFQPKNQKSLALEIFITNQNFTSYLIALTSEAKVFNPNIELVSYIKNTTFITKTIDPFAGSTVIEKFTEEFYTKTWDLFLKLNSNK